MTQRQLDFRQVVQAFKSKESPQKVGTMMREFYVKHLKDDEINFDDFKKNDLEVFDGKLPLTFPTLSDINS
jgi:hypothetical protein